MHVPSLAVPPACPALVPSSLQPLLNFIQAGKHTDAERCDLRGGRKEVGYHNSCHARRRCGTDTIV